MGGYVSRGLGPPNSGSQTFEHIPLIDDRVVSIYRDPGDKLWIGTWDGLFELDPLTLEATHYSTSGGHLPDPLVISVLIDSSGHLWVGTQRGLALRRGPASRFEFFHHDPDDATGLPHETVVSIVEDRTGVIWLGTSGGGLVRAFVSPLVSHIGPENGLLGRDVRAVLQDRAQNLWIGTDEGLQLLRRDAGEIEVVKTGIVATLLESASRTLWVGTYEGLYRAEPDGKVRHVALDEHITSLFEDRAGQLWMGTRNGILLKNQANGNSTRFLPQSDPGAPSPYIRDIVSLDERSLLLATNQGLAVFDKLNHRFDAFMRARDIDELTGDINEIVWLQPGMLAFATASSGAVFFYPGEDSLITARVADGLPSDHAREVLLREDETWIQTAEGLCEWSHESRRCVGLDINDRLGGRESTVALLEDGSLAVGGDQGLFIINPDELSNNARAPDIVLSEISVMGQPVDLPLLESNEQRIEVPYNRNLLRVDFAAADFTRPEKNRYRYRLNRSGWVDLGHEQTVTLTGMSPGNYLLELTGSNNNAVWSDSPAKVQIGVQPPFWGTWWFRFLILGFLAATLAGVYWYRMRRLRELQEVRERIADDLHDDIGSRASNVALTLEYLSRKSDLDRLPDQLDTVSRSAREIVDALRDTVWIVDAEKDSLPDLVDRLRSMLLERRDGISYHFSVHGEIPDLPLSMEKRRDILLIFKELVNNAARHSRADRVDVEVACKHGKRLEMTVRDDGLGFDLEETAYGRGLNTVHSRSQRMKADVRFDSKIGQGTSVTVLIPLR